MTVDQLAELIRPNPRSYAEKYYAALVAVMEKYDITTPLRQAHFLAQVLHESGRLRYTAEIASGDAYDTRTDLGNTPERDGDGRLYKGRGLIQLTGKLNYLAVTKDLGVDFVSHPERLEKLPWCVVSAGWFWSKKRLNELADADDFERITKKINGGKNGLEDRRTLLLAAKKMLGVRP